MITGKRFENQLIAAKEAEYLNCYYNSDNFLLSDAIEYYSVIFKTFLKLHEGRFFQKLDSVQKEKIYISEDELFKKAMLYAFCQGHQIAFALLLMDTKNSQEFDKSFFEKPNSKDLFIFYLDEAISKDVYLHNLNRSHVQFLIDFTQKPFENGYKAIMLLSKIFFKKGCEIAYMQIKKDIVGIEDKKTLLSKMLKVPYNADFTVTPAFNATFAFESPNFEEWDLHWDCTYGYENYRKLIGKILIHKFSADEIKDYLTKGVSSYYMLDQYTSSALSDDIYLGEINFSLMDPVQDKMRFIEKSDYVAIQIGVALTIKHKLNIDANRLLVTV